MPAPAPPAGTFGGVGIFFGASFLITGAIAFGAHALSASARDFGLTPIFRRLFAVGDARGCLFMLAVLAVAGASSLLSRSAPRRRPASRRRTVSPLQPVPRQRPLSRWRSTSRRQSPSRWRTLPQWGIAPLLQALGAHPVPVALGVAIVFAAGAQGIYAAAPLSMDEYAAVFQSQVFAAAHLSGRFPPPLIDWLIPGGFQNYFFNVSHVTGRVASAYWPSFALLLTPFTVLGLAWVCNPVISALTLLAVRALALRITGDVQSAGLAMLLTIASPVFFADGISFYAMPAHLLANTVYACLLAAPTRRRAWLAGLVGSVALTLHNPVPHLLFALPWIIALAASSRRRHLTVWLLAGYAPLCLLLGIGWTLFSMQLLHGGVPAPDALLGLREGASHAAAVFAWPTSSLVLVRLIGLAKLWAWAVPGLPLLAVAGAWAWRRHAPCALLASSALLTLLGYLFVPFDQGHGWGYRYFHSAWMVLPLLAAAALTRRPSPSPRVPMAPTGTSRSLAPAPTEPEDTAGTGASRGAGSSSRIASSKGAGNPSGFGHPMQLRDVVACCALLMPVGGVGERAWEIHDFIAAHRTQAPAYAGREARSVIFDTRRAFYGRDLIQNDPWLRDGVTRMITHGPAADAQMMRSQFPRRRLVYSDRFGTVWSEVPAPFR